jgi:hypothetical protein
MNEPHVLIVTLDDRAWALLLVAAELIGCTPDRAAGALLVARLEAFTATLQAALGPKKDRADA